MISIWTFLLSLVIFFASVAAVIYSFRDGNRIAIVLALDAGIISALGLVLNATTRGELMGTDLLVFCALPLAFAIAAAALCRFARDRGALDPA
ncbi:hypothetical protein [Subtercola lobariae]|uniref:Uncharacterized protein n=1 Tax=Subtercola lobariae TaxID=1588641 RepID=A0A917B2R2_9MICO|nr:hypothetical protein [Subtercola lobariae]GGF19689.1 hypothetical protein GCM10011399_11630 [Subtercola lobariae]